MGELCSILDKRASIAAIAKKSARRNETSFVKTDQIDDEDCLSSGRLRNYLVC